MVVVGNTAGWVPGAPGAGGSPHFTLALSLWGGCFVHQLSHLRGTWAEELLFCFCFPFSLSGSLPLSQLGGSLDLLLAFGGDTFVVKDTFWTWSRGCTCVEILGIASAQHRGSREALPFSLLVRSQAHKHSRGHPWQAGILFCLHPHAMIASSCSPSWGMSPLYVVRSHAEFWGRSLPAPPPKCVTCTLPHLCVTHSSPSHLIHLPPQVLHVTIPSLLEHLTNILCSHECACP